MPPYLLVLGVLVNLASSSTYIASTWKGKTKPNRVTFLLWSIVPIIATVAALSEGVGWAVVPVVMVGLLPFTIFLVSFANKNAYWKLTGFDYACGSFSLLALLLWAITNDPILAIVFAIVADLVAGIPTVIKAYRFPETEHFGAYAGAMFNNALVFFVVPEYTVAAVAFPAYIVSICLVILFGIYRKRLRLRLSV